ncbi:hypothetical protein Rs2_21185 [Raphanus sativus]|nr:hypothetical protein Rs2_21185 [Raphanus sativus]
MAAFFEKILKIQNFNATPCSFVYCSCGDLMRAAFSARRIQSGMYMQMDTHTRNPYLLVKSKEKLNPGLTRLNSSKHHTIREDDDQRRKAFLLFTLEIHEGTCSSLRIES